jgi:hypothetical protein
MGGSNETRLGQYRAHVSTDNGCDPTVHIHDDQNSLRFECAADTFKQEMREAIKELNNSDGGMIVIKGKTDNDDISPELFIGRYENKIFLMLCPDTSMKKDIESFLKGC